MPASPHRPPTRKPPPPPPPTPPPPTRRRAPAAFESLAAALAFGDGRLARPGVPGAFETRSRVDGVERRRASGRSGGWPRIAAVQIRVYRAEGSLLRSSRESLPAGAVLGGRPARSAPLASSADGSALGNRPAAAGSGGSEPATVPAPAPSREEQRGAGVDAQVDRRRTRDAATRRR